MPNKSNGNINQFSKKLIKTKIIYLYNIMENYSHILTINIDEEEFERDEVISTINDKIHNQIIYKTILDINIPIKWMVSNDNDFIFKGRNRQR
jgi:hypothetical protein